MLRSSVGFNSTLLAIFALVTAGVLAITNAATEERISEAQQQAARQALLEIVPRSRHNNDMLDDTQTIDPQYWSQLGLTQAQSLHIARQNGKPVAAIVPAVAADGYGGPIQMLVGVNADGTVAGVRVVSHQETPGLGDKIDLRKDDWILTFNGKSLSNPPASEWAVKKDGGEFDQFTGATITPRAVVRQVREVLEYFAAAQPLEAAAQNTSKASDG